HLVGTLASIYGLAVVSRVADHQSTPTASAEQKPGQQGAAAAPGLDPAGFPISVRRQQLLIALELAPLDVPFVVLLDDSLPPIKRLAMLVRRAHAAIDECRALLALPIGIRAGVERVLQYRDDVAVADGSPVKTHERLAIRGTREMHLLGGKRKQHLPRA